MTTGLKEPRTRLPKNSNNIPATWDMAYAQQWIYLYISYLKFIVLIICGLYEINFRSRRSASIGS